MPRPKGSKEIQHRYVTLNEAYAKLGVAIVEQACKDAKGYYNAGGSDISREVWQDNEVKRFFCSEDSLFTLCMPNTDGLAFYKQVLANYEKYGYYCPPEAISKKGDIDL